MDLTNKLRNVVKEARESGFILKAVEYFDSLIRLNSRVGLLPSIMMNH